MKMVIELDFRIFVLIVLVMAYFESLSGLLDRSATYDISQTIKTAIRSFHSASLVLLLFYA